MTGIETGLLIIAAVGLGFSALVGINISTSAPDRFKVLGNRIMHGFRSKSWKRHMYVSLSASRIPFLAICDFMSNSLILNKLKCSERGTQYITVSIYDNTFNWKIPETDSDVRPTDFNILIRIGGEYHGSATSFYIYYDDETEYKRFTECVLQPFAIKTESLKVSNKLQPDNKQLDEECGSQVKETDLLIEEDN